MGCNQINIYQQNSRIITCEISSSNVSLLDYETYFTVKEVKSGEMVFGNTGSLSLASGSWTGSYIIDPDDTDVDPDVYYYEITAASGSTNKFTIILDDFVVKDSVLY